MRQRTVSTTSSPTDTDPAGPAMGVILGIVLAVVVAAVIAVLVARSGMHHRASTTPGPGTSTSVPQQTPASQPAPVPSGGSTP